MQLDTATSFLASTLIAGASSIAILLFSFSRKENRLFLWAALASGSLTGTLWLISMRTKIPDLYTIILANELGILSTISFYETYCRILGIKTKERLIGPILLIIQLVFLLVYTYQVPDFVARVLISSISIGTMALIVIKFFINHVPKEHRLTYLFAAIPFILIVMFSILRITPIIAGTTIAENSFESTTFAITGIFYGIVSVWSVIGMVFILSNQLHAEISNMALIDPLTKANNRRAFDEIITRHISHAKRSGAPMSIIITDIDHFKRVNDSYGHQTGDAVLVHLATLFKNNLRTEDVCARYGGEEFIFSLPGIDARGAYSLAERLRDICKKHPLVLDNAPIHVTCSFGVASYINGISFEMLLKEADNALYQAKDKGRDRVVIAN